jgi:hypothetical protein
MKNQILAYLHDPAQLEKLYRADKPAFKRAFTAMYPELKDNVLAAYWHERLNFSGKETSPGGRKDVVFVVIASLVAGFIAKLPAIFHIDERFFYPRNIGFIVFPFLTAYFAWKNKLAAGKIAILVALILAAAVFINVLPDDKKSDTLILSCIHLGLFLWFTLSFAFTGSIAEMNDEKRINFLKYNGDLVVITGLILIAGAILSAVTVGLFSLIGLQIEKVYFNYVAIFGLAAAPLTGTYLTQTNPQLVGRVSPVIARIFSPLVLVMLLVYLIAIVYSGKDPYNDREFLLIFNALLAGVMAIIFFSIAGGVQMSRSRAEIWILFLLSVVTIVVNGIAVSAIFYRITAWGITPNRSAVLGANLLMLLNLVLVARKLFKSLSNPDNLAGVGKVIAYYLPVYCLWAMIVAFVFPLLFTFK